MPKKRKRKIVVKKRIVIKYIIYLFLISIVFTGLLFSMVYIGVFGTLPKIEDLSHIQNYLASEVYSDDEQLMGRYYIQNRTNAKYEDLPPHLISALIATEDVRFYKHSGIDVRSLFRVFFKTILLQNEKSGGGSTIHQQLAKNLFKRKKYSIISMPVNKMREMIIAKRINEAYSKNDILELYFNTVSFGENTFGIETASKRFFNKRPSELKIEESALLIGMLKATNYYNPKLQPEKSKKRRNTVLSQMVKYNYLNPEIAESLKQTPVKLNYVILSHNEGIAPYFREHLRMELQEWCKKNKKPDGTEYNIYADGLKIYTTINTDFQRYAERAVKYHLNKLQKVFNEQWKNIDPWRNDEFIVTDYLKKTDRYKKLKEKGLSEEKIFKELKKKEFSELFSYSGINTDTISYYDAIKYYLKFLHAGLISMEASTGFVRAWVGGINHKYFQYDHVTSKRQAGSVFKPVVYTAALENGHQPCDYLPNDSIVYEEYNNWYPRNADRKFGGFYSMKGALSRSLNTISVQLLMETGIDKVIEMARRMGIKGELPDYPTLALGTGEVSLLELVEMYSIFTNEGKKVQPVYLKYIEDKNGKIIYKYKADIPEQVVDKDNAMLMLDLLKAVVDNGTAVSLRSTFLMQNDIAGKTGTTQYNTDGWFVGMTPNLITGVWVGGESPSIKFRWGSLGQGASAALPVWANYMRTIYKNKLYRHSQELVFDIPEYIKDMTDCPNMKEEEERFMRKARNRIQKLIRRSFERSKKDKKKKRKRRRR